MSSLLSSVARFLTSPLLGDATSRFQRSGAGLTSDRLATAYDQLQTLGILLAGALAALAISWAVSTWRRLRQSREYRNPRQLFEELARAHALTPGEKLILREIAAWHRLPTPALLFIDPPRLQSPAAAAALGKPQEIAELIEKIVGPPDKSDRK